MLILRQRQIEAIAAPMRRVFEDKLIADLRAAFPEQCATMEELEIRQAIREGVSRATRNGFENDGQFKRWIFMMFTFGAQFESDPECPWAREVLRYGAPSSEVKMERLYKEALRREHRGRGLKGGGA